MASSSIANAPTEVRFGKHTVTMGGGRAGAVRTGERSARYGRWRAVTLASIYVLFGIHIAHWKLAGTTLAPLELNEVMYTLEAGVVTAGFLLMGTLFVGTAVFGRFFCSWACHIMALEDLCAWILRKLRIRVRPIRSRVLMLVPVITLLYMFVWPQILRVMEGRPFPSWRVLTDKDGWASFITTDFWRNLPEPWVAGMTFLVCGFAMVYVLGSRSFCFHACPYGAVFSAVDRIAPGRIKLVGDCSQCATCTAVCTSHVKVHEEIARFGKVVDANCLKDLDCVASCPQEALGYGFARPAPVASWSKTGRRAVPTGFSLTEDLVMVAVFLATVLVFRGLYVVGPFLMTLGLGAILGYLAVVCLRLTQRPDVRLVRARLKNDGALTRSGWIFVAAGVLFGLFFVHSAFIRYHEYRGQQAFDGVRAALQQSGQVPTTLLDKAVGHFSLARQWGLLKPIERDHQLASLLLKTDTPARAEPHLQRIVEHQPNDADSRLALARLLANDGRLDDAASHVQLALATLERPRSAGSGSGELAIDPAPVYEMLGSIHAARGDLPAAAAALERVVELRPDLATTHYDLGRIHQTLGDRERARRHFEEARRLGAGAPAVGSPGFGD